MGRLVKVLTVTAVLAVSLLVTGSSASADAGSNGKGKALPAAATLRVTWDAPGGLSGGAEARLSSITWE